MRVDDDDRPAECARGVLREPEQGGTVPSPLHIASDADQAQPRMRMVDEVDAHSSDDLAVTHQQMRKMTGLEFVRVMFVVVLQRQQGCEKSGEDVITKKQ